MNEKARDTAMPTSHRSHALRRLAAAVLLLYAGCAAAAKAPCPAVPQLTLPQVQGQVTEYIDSGRYDTDFAAVAGTARAWLEERARKATKPAIVLDIDETSLSNWPAYRVNGWSRILRGACDLENGPCGIRRWQETGRSAALPPTLALVRRARELGVAVFFITGRPPELRDATERNLREQGYEWDGVVLLPPGAHFERAANFKAPERRRIADAGYTIVLSIGDQESDLEGGFAEKTFKLPNPVYFLP